MCPQAVFDASVKTKIVVTARKGVIAEDFQELQHMPGIKEGDDSNQGQTPLLELSTCPSQQDFALTSPDAHQHQEGKMKTHCPTS